VTQVEPIHDISFLERTIEQVVSRKELVERLASGKQLRIKYGVDVTAAFLHTGHAVNLWMMRWLQERGHKVVFLVGNFTTRIGDPTGKDKTRAIIDPETIEKNAEEFIKQVSTILLTDPEVFEIRRNGDWYDQMPLDDFFKLIGRITHGHLVSRDMFRKRIAEGSSIHMHEFLYPVLQGWDSVVLKSDLTIVGSDQLFNEMMGRTFQQQEGQDPQIIITTKITPGLCGKKKQSKSLGNYIALADTPRDKFGKIMSIPDSLIVPYFKVYTDVPMHAVEAAEKLLKPLGDIPACNPMPIKKDLAAKLVERYHGKEAAQQERDWFEETFSKKKIPDDIPVIRIEHMTTVMELLKICKPDSSNSAIRKLVEAGAVRLDNQKLQIEALKHGYALALLAIKRDTHANDFNCETETEAILKIGKRSWFKVIMPAAPEKSE